MAALASSKIIPASRNLKVSSLQTLHPTSARAHISLHTSAPPARVTYAGLSRSHLSAKALRKCRARRVEVRAAPGSGDELEQLAKLDMVIDTLLAAKTNEELSAAIGQNVMSLNQKFFLRLATRSDSCESEEQKAALMQLASTVMTMLEEMVKATSTSMSESSVMLQSICAAAADPATGEFEVPLAPDKVAAMRAEVKKCSTKMDESVIAHAYSWIRKASDDKLDGMVVILQRVLQLYAAHTLVANATPTAEENTATRALEEVLAADIEQWDELLGQAKEAGYGTGAFVEELRKKMEGVVLGMANGSYSQRVMAEYLKEVEERANVAFEDAK